MRIITVHMKLLLFEHNFRQWPRVSFSVLKAFFSHSTYALTSNLEKLTMLNTMQLRYSAPKSVIDPLYNLVCQNTFIVRQFQVKSILSTLELK